MTILQSWNKPVLAGLLADRRGCALLFGSGAAQVGAALAGVTLWSCPILSLTGIPCPGCGLTQACLELLRGDWQGALRTHLFAPAALGLLVLLAAGVLLPGRARETMVREIARAEESRGMTAWVLTALLVYWFVRLAGWIPLPIPYS